MWKKFDNVMMNIMMTLIMPFHLTYMLYKLHKYCEQKYKCCWLKAIGSGILSLEENKEMAYKYAYRFYGVKES